MVAGTTEEMENIPLHTYAAMLEITEEFVGTDSCMLFRSMYQHSANFLSIVCKNYTN